MASDFKKCFDHILKWEGGGKFHIVKNDPGGATKWGVSLRAYKRKFPLATEKTIENLTYAEAEAFAYTDYWKPAKCTEIDSTSIALIIFDHTYNRGLASTSNLINDSFNSSIGSFQGKINFNYLNAIPPLLAIRKLSEGRRNQYAKLVDKVPKFKMFLKGWLNRVNDTEAVALEWLREVK
jgi:lysozyme family protein